MNWPIIQPCKYIPPTPSMHLSHILSRISHHSKCSKNTNFAPLPHPPHPWMKPCWFCYKLTFLRCQLPVGSNVALRWCILRKSCTGRKEKNWIWKRKAQICPLVDHAGRLSRFNRRREQGLSSRSQICFYSGRHCLIPDGLSHLRW